MLIVISFAIVNYNVIISSIQKDRFFDTFNPNILGVLASMLFIYFKDIIPPILFLQVSFALLFLIFSFLFLILLSSS